MSDVGQGCRVEADEEVVRTGKLADEAGDDDAGTR
jgi:hypothetical protein